MRRAVAIWIALAFALLVGCDTAGSTPPQDAPSLSSENAPANAPGGKVDICGKIRSEVSGHMTTLGSAIGKYVGYRAADSDSDQTEDARNAVSADIEAMATAISRLGGDATDDSIKDATSRAASALDKIGDDQDFVTDIKSLSDVPSAIKKLSDAAQPITNACSS
jgi:hypothetical protein